MSVGFGLSLLIANGALAWLAVLVALRENVTSRLTAILSGIGVLSLGLIAECGLVLAKLCGLASLSNNFRTIQCDGDDKFSVYDVLILFGGAAALLGCLFFLVIFLAEALRRRKVKS
ncbi:MAG: hypothetical protein R3D56_10960 [Paracoccaceae bacterium]